jgi:hypothetical protein
VIFRSCRGTIGEETRLREATFSGMRKPCQIESVVTDNFNTAFGNFISAYFSSNHVW